MGWIDAELALTAVAPMLSPTALSFPVLALVLRACLDTCTAAGTRACFRVLVRRKRSVTLRGRAGTGVPGARTR